MNSLPLVSCGLSFGPGSALPGTERAKETKEEMGWRSSKASELINFLKVDFREKRGEKERGGGEREMERNIDWPPPACALTRN